MWTGLYHFELGRNEQALRWLRDATLANPNAYLLFFYYGGVAGQVGSPDEARAAVETMRRLRPDVSLARLRAETPSDNTRYLAMRSRIIDGLAKAGLPET
jgi:tetratricopeptide (TPR) repeat protein